MRLEAIQGGWAAVGDGWAVFGSSEEEATLRFEEAERKHQEISARPVEEGQRGEDVEARSAMSVPGPVDLPFDLAEIKQRAEIRRTWLVGRIGNPVPWCRFCGQPIPSEWQHEQESFGHRDGCPAPDAIQRRAPDFDALLAEVERLQGR